MLTSSNRNRFIYLSLVLCYHFFVIDGKVIREEIDELTTNHEEANTLICTHVKSIDEQEAVDNIVVRASDTDIAIILLHHCLNMDVGISSKNTRRHHFNQSHHWMTNLRCFARVPSTPSPGPITHRLFTEKEKFSPYAQLQKDTAAQKAFSNMARGKLTDVDQKALMSFTAQMYGARGQGTSSLNGHRYNVFEK
jgi:hypothetical protein